MKTRLLWSFLFLLGIPMGIFITKWLFLFSLLVLIIIGIDKTDGDYGTFLLFRVFPLKNIYSEYGKFYLYVRVNSSYEYTEAYIYVDEWWRFRRIHSYSFDGLDSLKAQANKFLEQHYGAKKKAQDFKNKVYKDIYKDWNGTTTKQIDRDRKLEDLIS